MKVSREGWTVCRTDVRRRHLRSKPGWTPRWTGGRVASPERKRGFNKEEMERSELRGQGAKLSDERAYPSV